MSFSELHARSAFSFLRGGSQPEEVVRRAAELGYERVALPDHMGVYGSARAHYAAKKAGMRALTGATLEFEDGSNLPLLVKNREGYGRMCRLLTRFQMRARHSTASVTEFDFATLVPGSLEGLVCLTGDEEGRLAMLLLAGKKEAALRFGTGLRDLFGAENVGVELVRHHLPHCRKLEPLLRDLAAHLKLKVVAANAPLFATREARPMADAFSCLRNHVTLDGAGRRLAANSERHLKGPEEMAELFRDLPEAVENAGRLAEGLEFTLTDLGYQFPRFSDPETGRLFSETEQEELLWREAFRGAEGRCQKVTPKIRAQLEKELALIKKLGFSGYFLIVWEIKEFARKNGILCQGRGSAANSVVCYALGLTNVDPLTQNLVFERFLSENRSSWPDIDIDFPSGEQRERVIQHVYEKYAPHGAAMTANVITYRPRSAFREMSKILGFPEECANRFSEICRAPRSEDPGRELSGESCASPMKAIYGSGEVEALEETIVKAGIPANHPRLPALLHLYANVLRLPRHLGQHSGGMVISNVGLDSMVPLEPASMENRTILQWDKDDCEDLGIVKVDLLGLGMLAAMEDVIEISRKRGEPFDLAAIPMDDAATFELLQKADTVGTFQVESRAQMATLPIMRPRCFYDVAIEVAIIRPGPIVGDLLHPYLNRRQGLEAVDYIHPLFEPILKRTLGVPLFQEQILEMAMVIADFSGTEADQLRRAMAYKRSDERMRVVVGKLHAAMNAKNVSPEVQEKVVSSIQSFALYGFPESHAISFGLLAYASCWLKVHRTAAFYASLVNRQPMGFYSASTLLQDARRHGIRVRPVSLSESGELTEVVSDTEIRLGLRRVKGLSAGLLGRLFLEREKRAFLSLADFLRRVRPNKRERRLLAESGALNALPEVGHRREAMWEVEQPLLEGLFESVGAGVVSGHCDRDGHATVGDGHCDRDGHATVLAVMTAGERLRADFSTQGHSTGPHPLKLWRRGLGEKERKRFHRAADLPFCQPGQGIVIPGLVICRQRPGTAKGHCFISLEDETGISNIFVPRKTFDHYRLLISTEQFLLIRGHLQQGEGKVISVYAHQLEALPAERTTAKLSHDFY